MKIIISILIFSLTSTGITNRLLDFKINLIKHPVIDTLNSKPLIIDYEVILNNDVLQHKIECYPLVYKSYSYNNANKPILEGKESFVVLYDAFVRPDKKGFVLYRCRYDYEDRTLEDIWIFNLTEDKYKQIDTKGTEFYFTKDNKYIVLASNIESQDQEHEIDSCKLYYYNLNNYSTKPEIIRCVSYSNFLKLQLIKCEKDR